MNRIGTAIMQERDATETAVVVCERGGKVMIRTFGMGAQSLTVAEAKALRRGLSRAIWEAARTQENSDDRTG